jgi:hypothetical protein
MVRYLASIKWNGLIRAVLVAGFEAYGSALVGISPLELPGENASCNSTTLHQAADKEEVGC